MRNLTQTLSLAGFQMRPFASLVQKAVAAFGRLSASVLMPGLSEPVGPMNLLKYSHDASQSAWQKLYLTASGGKLVEDSTNNSHRLEQFISPSVGVAYTVAYIVKAAEREFIFLGMNGGSVGAHFASVNLTSGVVGVGTGTISATTQQLPDGSWLVAGVVPQAASTVSYVADLRISYDGVWGNRVYLGDGVSGIYLTAGAVFAGAYTAAEILAAGGIPRTTTGIEANTYRSPIAALPYRTYLDSLGLDLLDSVTQIDQPVGLALDGRGINSGELLANGDFSQGTSPWSFNTGWSLSGGKAVATAVSPGTPVLQGGRVLAGREYEVTYTIEVTSGSVNVASFSSGYSCPVRTASGTYTDRFTPTTTASGNFAFVAVSTFTGAVIRASLRDVAAGIEFVTNGDFSSPVGWGISDDAGALTTISGGIATMTNTSGTARLAQNVAFAVGKTYEVTWTQTGAGSAVYSGPSESLGSYSAGNNRRIFTATLSSNQIGFRNFTAGTSFTIDDVRIRDITGYHASQATTANKPVARRGIVNRVLQSSSYTNAAWTKTNSTAVGQTITENTAAGLHGVNLAQSFVAGEKITAAVLASAGARSQLRMYAGNGTAVPLAGTIDLLTGAFVETVSGTPSAVEVSPGVWLYAITTTVVTTTATQFNLHIRNGTTINYTGDGSSGLTIYNAGIMSGEHTAAEILAAGGIPATTTAAASSALGKQHYEFDGVNDLLTYGRAVMQQGSDNWVCASFEVASYPASQVAIFANSSTASVNPLVAYLYITNTGQATCLWRDDAGTAAGRASPVGAVVIGRRHVVTAARIGDMSYLWLDGVLVSSASNSLGATTVNTANVGALVRTSTTFYFAGDIYHLSFGQSTLTEAERKKVEAFAAQEAGVTL